MSRWTLGPEVNLPLAHSPGFTMRIADDLRKSVVFFGYSDPSKPTGITCVGTGFLLLYKNAPYLVTARHLSHQLGNDPFLLRVNKKDGTAENIHADGVEWFEHTDPVVDVAVVHFFAPSTGQIDAVYLDGDEMLASGDVLARENIGVGNCTYTIGLFRLLTGQKRNLPVCHMGSIALLPDDERIPVVDWTDPNPIVSQRRRIHVEAYLIEAQSMGGLSGSPVFVRSEISLDLKGLIRHGENRSPPMICVGRSQVRLLGLWQGAWEASPDEVRAAQSNANVVPVGMGVVVPSTKIIELLERDDVKKRREEINVKSQPPAAEPQAVPPVTKAVPSEEAPEDHRADFKRLLGAAVKRPKSSD